MKIDLWMDKLEKNNFACFPQLNTFIDETEVTSESRLKSAIKEHLRNIKNELVYYFPEIGNNSAWHALIKNPFVLQVKDLPTEDTRQFHCL